MRLYHEAARNRGYDPKRKYGNLRALIQKLAEQGIYNPELLKSYDEDEMRLLEQEICSSADKRFDYLGLLLLSERYLVRDFDRRLYELPQERYMIAAMDLMRREAQDKRLEYVKELYWALSGHYLTLATPTLRSAGLKHAQYASCYVDTVDDSLRGIYDSNTDVAELSKNGAGLGIFIGSSGQRLRYPRIQTSRLRYHGLAETTGQHRSHRQSARCPQRCHRRLFASLAPRYIRFSGHETEHWR